MTGTQDHYRNNHRTMPPPPRLVTEGKTAFGIFSGPAGTANLLDAGAYAVPLPRTLKRFRLKEWQAFQLWSGPLFMLVVLYNMKLCCLTQFVVYDRERGLKLHYEKIVPSWRAPVPPGLDRAAFGYRSDGYRIVMTNRLSAGLFQIDVDMAKRAALPALHGHFELLRSAAAPPPITVSIPFAKNRGMYSYKSLMPLRGELTVAGNTSRFDETSGFGIIDAHRGYYPYAARYDWCTGAVSAGRGLTGFNLTDNQSTDRERYHENCLWRGGKLCLLPPVRFARPDGVAGPWLIRDEYGMVDLVFTPVTENRIKMNLLLVKVDYQGPFGVYSGFIKDTGGKKVSMDGVFGMGERKYLRA